MQSRASSFLIPPLPHHQPHYKIITNIAETIPLLVKDEEKFKPRITRWVNEIEEKWGRWKQIKNNTQGGDFFFLFKEKEALGCPAEGTMQKGALQVY